MTSTDLTQKPFLTIKEYCELYGVGDAYVRELIKKKRLPGVILMGRGYKIPRDAIPVDSAVTPTIKTPATPEDEERAKKLKELEETELEIRVLEAKKKKAELEGTLLKGEELTKRKTEIAEMVTEAESRLSLADDRERQLNEREARLATAQRTPTAETSEALKQLAENQRAFDEDVKAFDKRAAKTTAKLDDRETKLQAREKAAEERGDALAVQEKKNAQRTQGLESDVQFLLKIVNALEEWRQGHRERALRELHDYNGPHWQRHKEEQI